MTIRSAADFEVVMGLEVHVQLLTHTKLFSGASTAFGANPNTQACEIDLALPGVLPVVNKAAIELAIKFGLAVNAQIHSRPVFARKHYFYPDLPKGYQISQMDTPIVYDGELTLDLDAGRSKKIRIQRAHLEEDAGKSLHEAHKTLTALDFNRAGVPLLEIVTDPDFRTTEEVITYLKTLHHLVRYLGISDGNMQEGSFRADVNLSIRPRGQKEYGTRVEIKNLNSFKFIEKAIEVETERQIECFLNQEKLTQETRLYDPDLNETRSMRSKETAQDYRYFPDPDLLPLAITEDWIHRVKASLPELPQIKISRYKNEYGLAQEDIDLLMQHIDISTYFDKVRATTQDPKRSANWIIGEILPALNQDQRSFSQCPISPQVLAELIQKIQSNILSNKTAKIAFSHLWDAKNSSKTLDQIISEYSLAQVSDTSALNKHIDQLFENYPGQIQELREGKDKIMGFLLGQVMKASQGKANAEEVQKLIRGRL
jgi:aspartyl-tRNA(Asn)/glutamyl-tRNA(Gln) amidotransferase subunit B